MAHLAGCCASPAAYFADAKKPEDWDDEEDGDWEAPRIANPKCTDAPGCGEWKRPNKPVRVLDSCPAGRLAGRLQPCRQATALVLLFDALPAPA